MTNSTTTLADRPARPIVLELLAALRVGALDVTLGERLALIAIAEHPDDELRFDELGRASGLSPSALAANLRSLEAKGLIARERRPPKRTKYSISEDRIRQAAGGTGP